MFLARVISRLPIAALLGLALFSAPARTAEVSPGDRVFLQAAAVGGLFEVEASKLALARGSKPAVKAFATMMVEDHSKANAKIRTLASDRQIALPETLDEDHTQRLAKLQVQDRGAAFDEAYADAMEDGHDAALRLFKAAADGADDAELRAFAADTLPVLESHNQHAEALDNERLAR